MTPALKRLFEFILLPPSGVLLLFLLAWLLRRWPRVGRNTAIVAAVLLYVCSIPAGTEGLARLTQNTPALDPTRINGQAIVVLSGGRSSAAPEYNADTVSRITLQRMRYAAFLHRRSGLPILVSGGSPYGSPVPEANLMARAFTDEFGITPRWVQGDSINTEQDAAKSAALLRKAGVNAVVLVTDAWHIKRAVACFQRYGLRVQAAPTGYYRESELLPFWLLLVPSTDALDETRRGLHELLGRIWYGWHYENKDASGGFTDR